MSSPPTDPEKALAAELKADPFVTVQVNSDPNISSSSSDSDSDNDLKKPTKKTYNFSVTVPVLTLPAWLAMPAWMKAAGEKIGEKMPTLFPGREKIMGLKRKTFMRALAAVAVVVLIIIIAVPAGVAAKKKKDAGTYIPLPSTRESHFGEATYYAPGLGACGHYDSEDSPVIALGWQTFDLARQQYPADALGMNGGACGRKIRLYRVLRQGEGPGSWIYDEAVKGGLAGKNATVEGIVGDRCPGCGPTDLDLGPVLFRKIATEGMGRVAIRWAFV